MAATVAIGHNDDIGTAIRDALDRLGGIRELVEGRLVAVKPNETWASRRDTTAVTQGDTLEAVLSYLKQFNPRRLVVSGGAGAAETADVLEVSGMMEAIRREGAEFVDHNRPPFVRVDLDHGPEKSVMVSEFVLEIETLVSLAQLKVHETATVTLGMKNLAMSFPAADYYGHPRSRRLHHNEFFADMHGFIVGMVKRFPIQLAIIAGHPAMVGRGPIGGKTAETGLVVASLDAVAADSVGAQLLGLKPQGVRHLYEAAQLGLGETDLETIEVVGLTLDEAARIFSERMYG